MTLGSYARGYKGKEMDDVDVLQGKHLVVKQRSSNAVVSMNLKAPEVLMVYNDA